MDGHQGCATAVVTPTDRDGRVLAQGQRVRVAVGGATEGEGIVLRPHEGDGATVVLDTGDIFTALGEDIQILDEEP